MLIKSNWSSISINKAIGIKFPCLGILLFLFLPHFQNKIWSQNQAPLTATQQNLRNKATTLLKDIDEKRFSKPDSAQVWSNQLLKIGQELGDFGFQSSAYAYLSWVNRVWGNNTQALDDGENALKAAESANDLQLQANALYEIGIIQHELEHFEEGRRSLTEAYEKFELLQDAAGMGRTVNSIGEIHRIQGEYSLAQKAYREARIHFSAAKVTKGLILIENNLGLVYAAKGECEIALDTLESARKKAIEEEFIGIILESTDQIARCQLALGRTFEAGDNAQFVLEQSQERGFLKYAKAAAKTLSDISIANGKFEDAFKYQEMHYDFARELLNEATQNRISSLNYTLELREKEAQIEVLNHDQKIGQLMTTMAVAGIGVLLLFGLILIYFYQRKRKNNLLLAQQNEALSELNREKDSLINIVAHDLKSPLSKTKGLLSLLPTMSPFNPQQQKVADMINKTLDEGDRLIRDLLDISSEGGSSSSFNPIAFELNKMLGETTLQYKENAAKKKLTLLVAPAPADIQLFTDDSFLSRIFDNLLSNAIKYSPSDTEIRIECGENGEKAWFSVQDHGPGFSDEDKEQMFRKFQRLSARPTGGESSNGLGLAIIQLLANKLKASIRLETAPGMGSKFIIEFPKRVTED